MGFVQHRVLQPVHCPYELQSIFLKVEPYQGWTFSSLGVILWQIPYIGFMPLLESLVSLIWSGMLPDSGCREDSSSVYPGSDSGDRTCGGSWQLIPSLPPTGRAPWVAAACRLASARGMLPPPPSQNRGFRQMGTLSVPGSRVLGILGSTLGTGR